MGHDWTHIRKHKLYPGEPPREWPAKIQPISVEGLSLLGIHTESGELYWDGKQVLIKRPFELGYIERWIAGLAAAGTFGVFVIELGRTLFGWPS